MRLCVNCASVPLWLMLSTFDAEAAGGEEEADDGLGVVNLVGGDQLKRAREGHADDLDDLVVLVPAFGLPQLRGEEDPQPLGAEAGRRVELRELLQTAGDYPQLLLQLA